MSAETQEQAVLQGAADPVNTEELLQAVVDATSWAVAEIQALTPRMDKAEKLLQQIAAAVVVHQRELPRVQAQLSSLEERDDRRVQAPHVIAGTPKQTAEAVRLLDEVRTEHARVRARLGVVSALDERLRRLEAGR